MRNCPKCGASLEDAMNFCPNCHADCRGGAPVQVANIQANTSNASGTSAQQTAAQPGGVSKTKKIISGICSLLVLVGVCFSCEYLLPWAEKQAEKEKLMEALQKYSVFSDLTLEDLAADGDHIFRIFPSERENESMSYHVSDIRIHIEDNQMEVIDKEKFQKYLDIRKYTPLGKCVTIEVLPGAEEKWKETQREWDEDDEDISW